MLPMLGNTNVQTTQRVVDRAGEASRYDDREESAPMADGSPPDPRQREQLRREPDQRHQDARVLPGDGPLQRSWRRAPDHCRRVGLPSRSPPSQGEALAAFSPGTAVVGTGDECGVFGTGAQTGVDALCNGGVGVRGASTTGSACAANPVRARASRRRAQEASGSMRRAREHPRFSRRAAGAGVVGVSRTSHGAIGFARGTGTGVIGASLQGFGGQFFGPVRVFGDFLVVGGSKSAVVPHRDGSYRQLYALESPESWFEDFGRARSKRGRPRSRSGRISRP